MHGAGRFVEIGDRVLFARYPQWDVSVGLVLGSERALVVDTRGSEVQGRQVVEDVARLALPVPVTVVVNTHVHYDHTFGNRAFDSATIHAHERVGQTFDADAERLKDRFRADPEPGPGASYSAEDVRDLLETVPRGPDVTFATTASVDLGDRVVHLAHAGRGHTDGDIRIWVPDAGVVFLGDLIEESADPSLGSDSWPLDWAATLDRHLAPSLRRPSWSRATGRWSTRRSSPGSGTRWLPWPRSFVSGTPRACPSPRHRQSPTCGCPTRCPGWPTRSPAATPSCPGTCA